MSGRNLGAQAKVIQRGIAGNLNIPLMLAGKRMGNLFHIRSKSLLQEGAVSGIIVYPFPQRADDTLILELMEAPGNIPLRAYITEVAIGKNAAPPPTTQHRKDFLLQRSGWFFLLHAPNVAPDKRNCKLFPSFLRKCLLLS